LDVHIQNIVTLSSTEAKYVTIIGGESAATRNSKGDN